VVVEEEKDVAIPLELELRDLRGTRQRCGRF
jgi:hypothetical protein